MLGKWLLAPSPVGWIVPSCGDWVGLCGVTSGMLASISPVRVAVRSVDTCLKRDL
jgi:hypothetical protein